MFVCLCETLCIIKCCNNWFNLNNEMFWMWMCIRSIWRIRFIWCILFCSIYLYITAPCCVWLYRWRNVAHFANSFIIHQFCVTHIWLDLNFIWNINDCICLNTYIYSSIRWNGINSFDVWLFFLCATFVLYLDLFSPNSATLLF